MIKKPDILSDEQLSEIEYLAIELPDKDAPESFKKRERRRAIAQAQLDVCAEYYEPLIKEMYEALQALIEFNWMNKGSDGKTCPHPQEFIACYTFGSGNIPEVYRNADKALAKVDKGIKKGLL